MSDGFAHDSTRISHAVVLILFSVFAIIAVVFRLWARQVQRARWAPNDYLCIVALIIALALSIFTIHSQIAWSLGDERGGVEDPHAILSLVILEVRSQIAGEVLWVAAVFFVRASALQLYIHLFQSTKYFRTTCYVVHTFNVAYFVSVVLAACLICRPIAYNWDKTIPGGSCGDQKHLDIFIGVFNLLMDLVVVVLPMPILWGLQMPTSRKVVLSGIFGMGIIICVITLIRIWVTTLNHGANAQIVYSMIALLAGLEALLGVINCCLPVMGPILTKFGQSKFVTTLSNRLPSYGRSTHGKVTSTKRAPVRNHYKMKNGAIVGSFETNKEMQPWPFASTTTHDSPNARLHPFVDDKAARVMFSHTTAGANSTPRPPPKSKYYSPENDLGEKGDLDIAVRRDWDVELGQRPASDESERDLLEDGKRPKAW